MDLDSISLCDVFIIDDEPEITSAISRKLKKEGFAVEISNNPLEALRRLGNLQPLILLVDYQMPQMNGVEFLKEARELSPNSLAIMLTGLGSLDIAMESINRARVYRFLTKPWDNANLAAILQEAKKYAQALFENNKLSRIIGEQNEKLLELNRTLEASVIERTMELENSLKELEKLNRIKSDFIANVSHEIRTPLSIIIGYVDLLQDGVYGPVVTSQYEVLGHLQTNANSLLMLVNDMLDLAQIESGKKNFNIEKFSLSELLKETLERFSPIVREKGLTLLGNAETPTIQMNSDRDKVTRVITNIIAASIRYTEKGNVGVTLAENTDQDSVIISIKDTSNGIAPEYLSQIFARFKTLPVNDITSAAGTGIGLALAKDLVYLLDGKISVTSEVGTGTTFTVELPREIARSSKEIDEERVFSLFSEESETLGRSL